MTSLTAEGRRAHEMKIFGRYLEALHKCGRPKSSREDPKVMDEYRKSLMTGFS